MRTYIYKQCACFGYWGAKENMTILVTFENPQKNYACKIVDYFTVFVWCFVLKTGWHPYTYATALHAIGTFIVTTLGVDTTLGSP